MLNSKDKLVVESLYEYDPTQAYGVASIIRQALTHYSYSPTLDAGSPTFIPDA